MDDALERAVDDEIRAHQPASTPPFEALLERKRRRDRGRLAAAGAAVAVGAIAVPTFAGLGSGGGERVAPIAIPSTKPDTQPTWDGRQGPLGESGGAATSCLETYSPTTLATRTFAFDGTVTAVGPSVSNRPDRGQYPLAGVTFQVHTWYHGGGPTSVTVDLPPPGEADSASDTRRAYDVGTRLLVSGEPRWGGAPLERPIAWTCGFTRYWDPATERTWQAAFD